MSTYLYKRKKYEVPDNIIWIEKKDIQTIIDLLDNEYPYNKIKNYIIKYIYKPNKKVDKKKKKDNIKST